MTATMVSLDDIEQARARIAGQVRRTQLVPSPSLSRLTGVPVHLKLEQQQITGSFKLRGATNAVLALSADEKARGVVGVSTGNYGRGLAHAAKQAGVRCIICMSALVPENKVTGIQALGAEVRIVGRSQDEAQVEVDRLVREEGMTLLPPFDHAEIIAGQGTIGLELLEDLPEIATLLVPLSGGGLIAGVARAVKARRPGARVIGISMARGAAMFESQKAGKPVLVEEQASLADSLGGGIGLDNRFTFAMVQELVDDMLLLSEAEIAAAVHHAYWQEQEVVEGGGAVGIGALLAGKVQPRGPTAIIVSGRNIDMTLHQRLIAGETVEL